MDTDLLRAELERLFELEELTSLSRDLLGIDPERLGGASTRGAFARALVAEAVATDAADALADAVVALRPDAAAALVTAAPPSDAAEPQLGDRVGPFLVTRRIGEGPLGVTFGARGDRGEVRLKVLRGSATRDRRALQRFLTYCRLQARLDDPGLPRGLTVGDADGRVWVAQDAVEGQTLAARIGRTGPMHLNEARELLRAVLEAVDRLHQARLVHGDLKLENIVVQRAADGSPRAALLDAGSDRLRPALRARGAELYAVASPRTVAPELLRGAPPSAASDVYAFGCVLFELLSGKPPFDAKTTTDAVVAHLTEPPRAPSTVAPRGWVTRELDDFVRGLLAKAPEARPASARAVLEQLEALGRPAAAPAAPRETISEEQLIERLDALVISPGEDSAVLALEEAIALGADPRRVAEGFLATAELVAGTDDAAARDVAKNLLFRAARLHPDARESLRAYLRILEADPTDATAAARVDELRLLLGEHEALVESLLERAEAAAAGAPRAAVLARIGALYANELDDREQALVAFTQAYCEDPTSAEHAAELERLAGSSVEAWGDVLSSCNDASTAEAPVEVKQALFAQMARWYDERYSRPDLSLACWQAILATEPAHAAALEGLTGLYRKAQQWQELGMLLLQRASLSSDGALRRDLRCEAAGLLENQLGDPAGARSLYQEVLAEEPGHPRATEALARILEKSGDWAALVTLLETQTGAARDEERRRMLSRIAEIYEDRLGDDEEAARRYAAVLDEQPTQIDALRGLDRIYSKLGRYADLLENLAAQVRAATTPRQKIGLWERIAAVHDEEFLDHERAAAALEEIVTLDPAHDGALTALARHYRALSRWDTLAALYERHLAQIVEPERKLGVALLRARVLADQVQATDPAIRAFEDVLAMSPGHAGALEALARLRETAGHEDAALAAVDALADRAESPAARAEHLARAARLLEARGDRDGAITRYKAALDATPGDLVIAASLRSAYVARGDVTAAAELLEKEIEGASGDRQKAALLAELAELARSRLKDDERAEKSARQALELDPTNLPALSLLADITFDTARFVEAATLFEKLAARVDGLEQGVAVRALERYVDALARSGSTEKALSAMDALLRLAPDDAQALTRVASVTFEHGAPGRARELYADLLARFSTELPTAERALATYRLGEAARRSGDLAFAIETLESAVDLDPTSVLPLEALALAHEAGERWDRVVDAKTRHLDLAEGEIRLRLLIEVGELAATKLADRALATKSLVAALDERPDDRKLLARLMQLYSEEKDWQKLVDVVVKLAEFVDDPRQKAKYLQTAAMVTGRELHDLPSALRYYDRAAELDPANDKVVDDAIELCESAGDHDAAVERLRARATAASAVKDTPRMLSAFNRLATIYLEKLGRIGHAIDALEAAQTLEPDDAERNQKLAELYASNPERYMAKAVEAQVGLIRLNPFRVESYKLLRRLYTDSKRADPAFCLCQALYVLKLSDADEERFFRRMRSEDPAYAQDVMSPEDWTDRVDHPDADPVLTSLFALIEPAVVAARCQAPQALGYDPRFAVDAASHPYPVSQTLHYAAGVTGIALPPIFENSNDPGGLGFLPTAPPSIVLGTGALAADATPQALAFLAGRHLAYYRPGFHVRQLVASTTALRAWLFAAIRMNVPQFPVAADVEGPVREAVAMLERSLTPQHRDHLSRVVSRLIQSGAALDLRRWVQGVDLTADRTGFVLAHDLETSVEIVRASDESSSSLTPQVRLKELVLYAIGEPYFALRQRLGISVDA